MWRLRRYREKRSDKAIHAIPGLAAAGTWIAASLRGARRRAMTAHRCADYVVGDAGVLDLGDQHLEWRAWGEPDAPLTLVLLHEGLGCVGLWLDFPGTLAQATGCRVFAYSRAGYGGSSAIALPRPLDYMTREARDVLPRVLDAARVQDVVLVGHSDGASIAAIYAGMVRDERLRGVVLIAPHFFPEEMGLAAIAQAREEYEVGGLREKLARWHAHVDCAFFGWSLAWLDAGFRDWNIEHVLPGIRVPVCVIQGERDAYGTLAQVRAVEAQVARPVETHVLPGVGHSPHREATDETVRLVGSIVDRCKSTPV